MGDKQVWRGAAKCRGLDYSLADKMFFPSKGKSAKDAKSFCGSCPVKVECLEFALIYNEQGVFGGTTTEERSCYPDYIIRNLKQREASTVGLESRSRYNLNQAGPSNLEVHLVTVQVVALSLELQADALTQPEPSLLELLEELTEVLSGVQDLLSVEPIGLQENVQKDPIQYESLAV